MMKSIYRQIFFILSSILLFGSCHKEIYDPEALERDYFIQNIPEGFNWSTISLVNLEVIPYDQYAGQYLYTIEVFDKNPLLDQEAILFSTGWCTAEKPLKKTITLPDVQSLIYIRQTTPGGRRTIKEIEITSQNILCDFTPDETPAAKNTFVTTKGQDDIPDQEPDNCIELDVTTGNIQLEKNKNYILTKDFTGKINFPGEGKCNLYIKSSWTMTSDEWSPVIIQNNSNIYLLSGGQIQAGNNKGKFQFSNEATFGISKNAQLGEEGQNNIILQYGSKGYLINEGKLYCDRITAQSKGFEIINKGQFYANSISSGDSYSFDNECYAYVKSMEMSNGSNLEIAPSCCFVSDNLTLKKASIKLNSASMLEVGYMQTVDNGGQNVISGIGNRYALARINELDCGSWNYRATVIFNAKVYVGCNNYPTNKDLYKINTYEDIASGATIEIEPSECSKGNNYIPEQPEQPEFPKWVVYNHPYTFASEDNYPSPGDYDMNDLVTSIDSIAYYYVKDDDDNAISKMRLYMTVRAVGAIWQLGAAIQLDELDAKEIKSVNYSKNVPLTTFSINDRGVEENQEHAVIPLFDNAHKMLGINNTNTIINTIDDTPKWITDKDPSSFEVTIEFNSPVDEEDIEMDELNYFTIVGTRKEKRTEIHLPDKEHSDLSSTPRKEQFVDEKFMWTIRIPGIFNYPHEWISIKEAYPHFEAWVQSGGDKKKDWYLPANAQTDLLYKRK